MVDQSAYPDQQADVAEQRHLLEVEDGQHLGQAGGEYLQLGAEQGDQIFSGLRLSSWNIAACGCC